MQCYPRTLDLIPNLTLTLTLTLNQARYQRLLF